MKTLHSAALALVAALALGTFLGVAVVSPTPASAETSFTIDELDPPGVILADPRHIVFTGTITTDSSGGIFLYVDDRLLTCEEYFGNDINASVGCWRIATVEGGTWRFAVNEDELNRLELELLGSHSFRFVVAESAGASRVIVAEHTLQLEVVDELPVTDLLPEGEHLLPGPTPGELPAGSSSQLGTGEPAAPSVLSSLTTAAALVDSPPNVLVAIAVTIVLLLLVGLPSTLLGATLSDNYDRIFGPVTSLARRITRPFTATLGASTVPTWLPLGIGIVAASVLSSFVDPGFGLNWGSARMLMSMALAFVIETLLGWVVIRAVLRRTDPGLDPKPEFKWGSLVLILVAVILSRLVGFEPGMVFGLVMGLAFGVTLARAQDVRVTLLGIGWAIAVGLLGWVGFSLLAGVEGWLPVLVAETFSGIAVGSLAALPVALLPLRGLDGETLFSWNRWIWAGVYGLGLLMFFIVLMPMPFSWGEVGAPLVTWLSLYLAYAALAFGVWAWFRFQKPKTPSAEPVDTAAA